MIETIQEVTQRLPRRKPELGKPLEDHAPLYVTPSIPRDALNMARSWMTTAKMPVLILAPDHTANLPGTCPNCAGWNRVYMRKCTGGPYAAPIGMKEAVTWFDGDGQFKRGWYNFQNEIYDCPVCNGGKKL